MADSPGYSLGLDFASSIATSSPFVNNAGINFGGDQGGVTTTGDSAASATATAARQLQGGIGPIADSSDEKLNADGGVYAPDSIAAIVNSPNTILYVVLGVFALITIVLIKFRK